MRWTGLSILPVVALVAVGTVGSYRSASSRADLYEMLEPVMMPAPDETILYDDSTFLAVPLADSVHRYWAVAFKPDSFCSLKVGLVGTFPSGTAPECTFFVWKDGGGMPEEPPVFVAVFTTQGLPAWDNVTVTPPLVDSSPFWIGYWLPNVGPDPLEQDLPACDTSSPGGNSFVSSDRVSWQLVPDSFPGYYDLAVRARVNYFSPARHDVELTDMIGLSDTVFCDSALLLEGVVRNRGDTVETFGVVLEIDTTGTVFFADTQQVAGLAAGSYDTVAFDTFRVPHAESLWYGVLAYTALNGDDSTANDSLQDSAFGYCLWVHDVAVCANISPLDTGFCDSTYQVRAEIANCGDVLETGVEVEALIDTSGFYVYGDTVYIDTLWPGDTVQADFAQWHAGAADSLHYGIRYTSLVPGDVNGANDTLRDTTFIYCYFVRDVCPVALASPGDTVLCDSVYPVTATIWNRGTTTETFDVRCTIDTSGTPVFDSTKSVLGLPPDSVVLVEFTTGWQVPMADSTAYRVIVATLLAGDFNRGNDTLVDTAASACLWIHDVGPVGDIVPETLFCDSAVLFQVTVHNWGQVEESFGVELVADSSGLVVYADTAAASGVMPDSDLTVSGFTPWVTPLQDGVAYEFRASTLLSTDVDSSDNTLQDTALGVCLWRRDVGTQAILWPRDTVFCDSSGWPAARVRNSGQLTETFDVGLWIDTSGVWLYGDTATVAGLEPDSSRSVYFTAWSVPHLDGVSYGITAFTMLGGDDDAGNDTVAGSALGYCIGLHDVSPTLRVAPPDTVFCEEEYPVWVEVANQGDFVEDFDLVCLITDTAGVTVYTDTVAVLGLGPGSSDTAAFATDFAVPPIDSAWYRLVLHTVLSLDANPSNDTLADSTYAHCLPFVERDVAVVSIVNPPDTVFCDSTVKVRAYVKNTGRRVEFFNVECLIDSGLIVYADTGAAPGLLPGDSMLISFLDWKVPPADSASYTVAVRTLLAADTFLVNDTLSKSVFGLCLAFHDVGILDIVSPPDTVFVGSNYTPRVNVHNWGNRQETFDVVCTIDGYADTQSVSGLDPGWSVPVFFADWNVGSPGTFDMDVFAVLPDDENAGNDSASKRIEAVTGMEEEYLLPRVPVESGVLKIVPNPSFGYADVYYEVAEREEGSVSVYDLSGRLVKSLFEGEMRPGYYSARWDGNDDLERPVPNGVYVCKLRVGKVISSKKLVVVR